MWQINIFVDVNEHLMDIRKEHYRFPSSNSQVSTKFIIFKFDVRYSEQFFVIAEHFIPLTEKEAREEKIQFMKV